MGKSRLKKSAPECPFECGVGVGDASWEMHHLHDVLQFFLNILKKLHRAQYSFRNSQVKQADICADIVQISAQKIGN